MKKVTLVLVVLCLMVSGQVFAGSVAKLGLSLKSNLEATAATGGAPGKNENGFSLSELMIFSGKFQILQ